MKKGNALVVTLVLGSTLTRKKGHVVFVHPPKDLAKEPRTERHLEDEKKDKAKTARVVDA